MVPASGHRGASALSCLSGLKGPQGRRRFTLPLRLPKRPLQLYILYSVVTVDVIDWTYCLPLN